jgi:hypothetical protein
MNESYVSQKKNKKTPRTPLPVLTPLPLPLSIEHLSPRLSLLPPHPAAIFSPF